MLYKLSHMIGTQKACYLLDIIFCSDSDIKPVVNCKQKESVTLVILLFLSKLCIFPFPDVLR